MINYRPWDIVKHYRTPAPITEIILKKMGKEEGFDNLFDFIEYCQRDYNISIKPSVKHPLCWDIE